MHTVYIGLGSNLDNPLMQIKTALTNLNLDEGISIDTVSNIYQSVPLEIEDKTNTDKQDDYINAVARITTDYNPNELLDILQSIEKKHNRVTEYRWGPRSLDLDILLFDDLVIESEQLTIPHIELKNRDFVLYPLNDINPELNIPKCGQLKKLLSNVSSENLNFIESAPKII